MNTILNYTPHTISVVQGDASIIAYPSIGVARVAATQTPVFEIAGIVVVAQEFGEVTGLPEAVEGTFLVVSGMVLSALKGRRSDVIGPDTGPTAIRENGQVVAVTRFVK